MPNARSGDDPPNALIAAILVVGLCAAIGVYVSAGPRPDNPLGYETKQYVRALQMYGGTANELATQFREWFDGLWHGRNLAYTIAVITIGLALALRFFTLAPHPPAPVRPEAPPRDLRKA